jgi:serine/threonine-protein kinase
MTLPHEVLETYENLGRIREGGMGAIYKVRHRRLGALRVVKILHSEDRADPELIARFAREARLGGELSHPNLAQILDLSEDCTWAVMEYIDGVPLDEMLRTEGPLPVGLAVEVVRQALSALAYLHKKGSVHRDVSPDNLMLTRDGAGRPVVKLIDLGIAKSLRGTGRITAKGLFLGKPRYASPEQAAGDRDRIDARSDLYSLGLVLYELVTGQRAFEAGSIEDVLNDRVSREPLGFEVTDPAGRVPPDLRAIVMKALERHPAERFASAEEMSRALAAVQVRFPLDAAAVAVPEPAQAPPAPILAGSTRKSRPEPTAAETWRGPMPLVVPELPEIRQAPEVLEEVLETLPAPPVRTAARPRSHSGEIAVALGVLTLALLLFLGVQQTGFLENPSTTTAERESPAPAPILEPAAKPTPVATGGPPRVRKEDAGDGAEPVRKQEARKAPSPGPSPSREVARPSPPAGSRSVSTPVEPREEAVSVPIELSREPSPAPKRRRPSGGSSGTTEWVSASPISVPVAPRPEAVQGYEGKVLVEVQVRVDTAGNVAETRALHVSPANLPQRADFERAALAAARQARFNPGTENGVAVESFQVLTFTFEPL